MCKGVNKEGELYNRLGGYVTDKLKTFLRPLPSHNKKWYFNILLDIILVSIKNYTRMYKQTTDLDKIYKNEKNMLKLLAWIASLQ